MSAAMDRRVSFHHWMVYVVVSPNDCGLANGEPLIAESAPVFGSIAYAPMPALLKSTYRNFPEASAVTYSGASNTTSGDPLMGVRLPVAESNWNIPTLGGLSLI